MIDIRYHIATLIAVFVALGVGILIGSTLVSGDVLVEQQKKMITQLETQFNVLRERETELIDENSFLKRINEHYEDFSQAVSPPLFSKRLNGYRVALVVTGGEEVPSGLVNSLSLAGAKIESTTVILPAIKLSDSELSLKRCDFFELDHATPPDELRRMVALSTAGIVLSGGDIKGQDFLEDEKLIKFNGKYGGILDGVILVGGAEDETFFFPDSVDFWIIKSIQNARKNIIGCETSGVEFSYMEVYQELDLSTVDDIDLTPGQIALIRAMEGETGDYGVKETARKFMPSLPAEFLRSTF